MCDEEASKLNGRPRRDVRDPPAMLAMTFVGSTRTVKLVVLLSNAFDFKKVSMLKRCS